MSNLSSFQRSVREWRDETFNKKDLARLEKSPIRYIDEKVPDKVWEQIGYAVKRITPS